MVRVRIVIEGGGSGANPDKDFRQAWTQFFKAAGLVGQLPRVVRGEGRQQTFDKFKAALQSARRDEVVILLVDSEGPVQAGHSAWHHLRDQDNWDQPPGADDDSAYLMIQVMETWFLADREALRRFFGPPFNESRLRQWPNLEEVHRDTVYDALEQATSNCQKQYRKGRVSFQLLAELNPQTVAAACPHADQLLQYLRTL